LVEVGKSNLRDSLRVRDTDIFKFFPSFFNPYRILIMRALAISGEADYRDLRQAFSGTSDGNLVSHLRSLEEKGYITSATRRLRGKALTTYRLTNEGLQAFDEFRALLKVVADIG
jgi:DNA-binding transcriptional ArsR family regulator